MTGCQNPLNRERNPRRICLAARLAEAGVGEFMLMSVMGWTNPNQARKYIEKASRAKMAGKAMQMLDEEQN